MVEDSGGGRRLAEDSRIFDPALAEAARPGALVSGKNRSRLGRLVISDLPDWPVQLSPVAAYRTLAAASNTI